MADIAKLIYKKNTLYSSGGGFSPETQGSAGQVLTKTATGYDWDDGSNTKVFELPADLTSADAIAVGQAVYDWYSDGKNPIVLWGGYSQKVYCPVRGRSSASVLFLSGDMLSPAYNTTKSMINSLSLSIMISNGTVTGINGNSSTSCYFLQTDVDYSTPYTPQYNGSPATKKYVDDAISSTQTSGSTAPSSPTEGMLWYDTTNDVLKVYDGTDWAEVGGGGGGERPTTISTHSNSSDSTNDTYVIPYDGIIVASGDVVQNGSTGFYNSGCTVSVGGRTIYTCYKSNYDAYKRESGPKMMTCRAGETLTATLGSQGGSWSYTYFSY